MQDFEPIIIEEVFYNGRAGVGDMAKNTHSITPQVIFNRVKMMQKIASSKASSFISHEQSTAHAGYYPKLSLHNKILLREHNHDASVIKDPLGGLSDARVDSDESCDFFSDNLSETAAGALPENQA